MLNKKYLPILALIPLVFAYAYYYSTSRAPQPSTPVSDISTFEECVAAGYPVIESYPEKCLVPGGNTYTRVTTDIVPSDITLSGTYTCLPKVDTGAPVTLECAFGLQAESGYYSLDTSAIPSVDYPVLMGGEEITVEGSLVPIKMISSDRWHTYDVIGVIAVDKLTK